MLIIFMQLQIATNVASHNVLLKNSFVLMEQKMEDDKELLGSNLSKEICLILRQYSCIIMRCYFLQLFLYRTIYFQVIDKMMN